MHVSQGDDRSRPRIVQIVEDQAGQRLDNFLLTQLKGVPRSHVYRIVRKGEVRVNKRRVRPDYRLQTDDQVRIPPLRLPERGAPARPGEATLRRLENSILYEDDTLIILDKPSGIAVHGGSGLSYGVIEALRAMRPRAPFLELVHRLDRDTSGCLMVAKRRSELRRLHRLLREGGVTKHYQALVKGRWRGGTRTVRLALRKNVLRSGERMVRVSDEGREAVTVFRPERRFATVTLMDITLETGRTHQIRVHSAHLGHPLAGDTKYGDPEFNRALRGSGLKRLFLHASALEFTVPDTHKAISVRAPLPRELEDVLQGLEDGD